MNIMPNEALLWYANNALVALFALSSPGAHAAWVRRHRWLSTHPVAVSAAAAASKHVLAWLNVPEACDPHVLGACGESVAILRDLKGRNIHRVELAVPDSLECDVVVRRHVVSEARGG